MLFILVNDFKLDLQCSCFPMWLWHWLESKTIVWENLQINESNASLQLILKYNELYPQKDSKLERKILNAITYHLLNPCTSLLLLHASKQIRSIYWFLLFFSWCLMILEDQSHEGKLILKFLWVSFHEDLTFLMCLNQFTFLSQ